MFSSSFESALGQAETVEFSMPSSKELREMYGGMKEIPVVSQVFSFATAIPVVGNVISKVFGGMFKKATKMESCMKWWTSSNLYNWGPSDVIPIDLDRVFNDIFGKLQLQYKISFDVFSKVVKRDLKNEVIGFTDKNARLNRAKAIFIGMAYANSDMFRIQCAAQHRDETGAPPELLDQVTRMWNQMREAAKQKEFDEVLSGFERRIKELILTLERSMISVHERGKVFKQALLSGKTVVEFGKATFKYTPSGIPLAVVGELPCCCGKRFPNG